jgi:Tfp pilus assembly protein FimT
MRTPVHNRPYPLGLAVAAAVICLLASIAIPRLRAVSEEQNRPEAPRILSAYPLERLSAVMSDSGGGGVVASRGWQGR